MTRSYDDVARRALRKYYYDHGVPPSYLVMSSETYLAFDEESHRFNNHAVGTSPYAAEPSRLTHVYNAEVVICDGIDGMLAGN